MSLPRIAAATAPVAYVRFHGRNWRTWNLKGRTSAERFDWMYDRDELAEWVEPLRELAAGAGEVYALMNNNRYDYAPRSATDPPRPARRARRPGHGRDRAGGRTVRVAHVNVLSVIHGTNARAGTFGEAVAEAGHVFDEWSLAWGTPAPRPIDDYDAIFVFGGSMHADQDDRHPWLREENLFIQRLLGRRVPLFGVCLGVQLIAKAAGARVYPCKAGPEIGWMPVELTGRPPTIPFSALPRTFDAFGWHYYTYDLPAGAEELARSDRCNQAFRLGEAAWGIQFHAEVTLDTVRSWLADKEDVPADVDPDALGAETEQRIGEWNRLGRQLCGAFLEAAQHAAVAA